MKINLDLAASIREGEYAWELMEDLDVRVLRHVTFCAKPSCTLYQSMNIYAPKDYVNSNGEIDPDAAVNGFTAATAPVIFRNSCSGWMSSDPDADSGAFTAADCARTGWVYVTCGARSRDLGRLGKAPAPTADLKAAIRFLRRNSAAVPGSMDRIISVGGSGAGQMSSVLGAAGNHPDYLPWLYEMGAVGAERLADGSYVSTVRDDVYGCMCF